MTKLDCCCCCESKRCRAIFRNKCCICCLVFLGLLIIVMIGAKVYITAILNEVEEDSFDMTFHGLADEMNHTEHPLASWQVPEDIRKEISYTLSGFDRFGRPVWILPFGQWNIKGLLNANDENEKQMKIFSDKFVYLIQQSMHTMNVSDWVLITDMDGYSYSQLASFSTIGFLIRMTKKMMPMLDLLAYGYVINLDYFSNTFVNMMRPIVGSLMDRLETTGSDKDKYVQSMLKKIPANQLPQQYGGSKDHAPVGVY